MKTPSGSLSSTLTVTFTLCFALAQAVPASDGSPCKTQSTWKSWHETTTFSDCQFAGDRNTAAASGFELFEAHGAFLGLDPTDLQLIEVKHGLASSHSRYRQMFQGRPVFGGLVSVHQRGDGSISHIHRRVFDIQRALYAHKHELSLAKATDAARRAAGKSLGVVADERLPTRSEQVWFPIGKNHLVPAWELMIYSAKPLGDFLTVIDARNGAVLFQENRIAFGHDPAEPEAEKGMPVTGSGLVYVPNPMQTTGDTGLTDGNDATNGTLDAERVNVTLLGLDSGTGLLTGEYVDMTLSGGLNVAVADEMSRVYEYDRDDPRFEQVVIYHSIDSIQRYFHSLGFDDANVPPNGIRDFPSLANAHWDNADQSFYSTGDDGVHFGDGGVDDGEDADIIAHEYGHAIQHNQNASWGGGEMGAMGEGFGDYLAMSFYHADGDATYQAANNPCVGEWDATSYSSTTPPCLRRTDGTKMYPDDLVGQVHADGEIWSRALWDIRNVLGGPTTDTLVLEHHFALPGSATMPTAALAMITADANLNGGANDTVLREKFCDRGILEDPNCLPALAAPILTFPAGGETLQANSTVDITWQTNGAPGTTTYTVEYVEQCTPGVSFSDDMESGAGLWAMTHGAGTADWALGTTNPQSGTSAFFASEPDEITDQYLALGSPLPVAGEEILSVWHDYNTESGFDGGVIEVSTNGGSTWTDLGPMMTQNGYNNSISTSYNSPIGGQEAFSGSSGGYVETLVDLSSFAGQSILIRFRMASDESVSGAGWHVDDVSLVTTGAWTTLGTSAAGANSMPWTVPDTPSDDYCVRLTGQSAGFSESLVTGAPFTVDSNTLFIDGFDAGNTAAWGAVVGELP